MYSAVADIAFEINANLDADPRGASGGKTRTYGPNFLGCLSSSR